MENNDCLDQAIHGGASEVVESVKWTNEKHKSYLNSIEASFVKQLDNNKYNSNELFDWLWRTPIRMASPGLVPKDQSIDQFKDQHRNCWENSEFEKDDDLGKNESVHRSHLVWRSNLKQGGDAVNFKNSCKLHKVSVGSVTEVSGQNFVDTIGEDEESRKKRGKKRARSTVSSITDQVVPFMPPKPKENKEFCKNKLQKREKSLLMKSKLSPSSS